MQFGIIGLVKNRIVLIHFNIRFTCKYKLNCYFTYKIFTNDFRNSLVTYTQLQCSLVFLLLVVNRKQQKEIFKEVDKVNYHVNGMENKVVVTKQMFLYNYLSIVNYVSTSECSAKVQQTR